MRAALFLAALSLVACGRSSTEPAPGNLHTNHGTIIVITQKLNFNVDAATLAINNGYDDAKSLSNGESERTSINGEIIIVEQSDYTVNNILTDGAWYPPDGPIHIREGHENVLRYEVLHPICHQLGLPNWCSIYKVKEGSGEQ